MRRRYAGRWLEAVVLGGEELGGRYRLEEVLGRGGMGEVWRGFDPLLKRAVAVKVLAERLHQDVLELERFRREAEVAGGLQHPNVTVVYDVGHDDGRFFFVMELLDGEDLTALVKRHPEGMPLDLMFGLAIQCADALAAAHRVGVVHRDVKPANIMVVDGRVKLCDFGIARVVQGNGATSVTAGVGTAAYMAPEQFQGLADSRADLYALGCVLYEMCTGDRPFHGVPATLMYRHCNVEPTPPGTVRPELPARLEELVLWLMAKKPEDRPQRAEEVVERLRSIRRELRRARAEIAIPMETPPPAVKKTFEPAPVDLLRTGSPVRDRTGACEAVAEVLRGVLRENGVDATLGTISRGPTISRYEIRLGPTADFSTVQSLRGRFATKLGGGDVSIVPSIPSMAALPGGRSVGVDVVNADRDFVSLGDVLRAGTEVTGSLMVGFGRTAGGPVLEDLSRLPHLLIAGGSGSEPVRLMHSIVASLLVRAVPDDLCMVMAGPTGCGLSAYEGVPHLVAPVSTTPGGAVAMLRAIEQEMERRYDDLAAVGHRDIDAFNRAVFTGEIPAPAIRFGDAEGIGHPRIAVLVAELSELMGVAAAETEAAVNRLTQLGRAAGIHLVLATQDPSSRMLTTRIRANIPARLAFAVSSQKASELVVEDRGAENLLDDGDGLLLLKGSPEPVRIQCASISDVEIEAITAHWRNQR